MERRINSRQLSKRQMRKRRFRRRVRRFFGICLIFILILTAVRVIPKISNIGGHIAAERLEREGYPESLVALMERNPEAKQFVLNYEKNKDKHEEIDLSGEVSAGEIPLFLQWDERWGYETYGDDFLAVTGCGPTCLAMVRCGLGGDTQWNPYKVASMAQEQGFYVEGTGSSWELMDAGAQQIGLSVNSIVFDEEHILSALESGMPIICAMGPGDFTTAGHFIVLTGVDDNGKVIVNDPNSKINSEKTWDMENLMSQIRNLWGYSL